MGIALVAERSEIFEIDYNCERFKRFFVSENVLETKH